MATPLERLYQKEKRDLGIQEPETPVPVNSLGSKSTTIGGERVDVADPLTSITFVDDEGHLSGKKGRPRPRVFWHARQLGQTPPMELLKNTVSHQLTGGRPLAESDEELQGPVADLAAIVVDIYEGPHFQEKTWDNLIVDAVNDLVDTAWAYWEGLYPEGGDLPEIPVAFKPLPPLQIQHNIDTDTGQLIESPAFYHIPFRQTGGTIQTGRDATGLDRDRVVVMREPHSSRSDRLYGESIATRVREWLELIVDVDVHQKRFWSDSQLPAGFLHFVGNISDDELNSIQQDIREAAGDPHELVTTKSADGVSWVPVGDAVVDLDAIQEQQWYYKLVFAAAGLNLNELGIIEGSGFAKETPALQRAIFKKVTKPFMGAILGPQNSQVLPQIGDAVGITDIPFRLAMERFDPVQEQIERDEKLEEWTAGTNSLNELRGGFGRDAEEYVIDVGGTEIDLANTPKYIVDKLVELNKPQLSPGNASGTESGEASFDHGEIGTDPVMSMPEVGEHFGIDDPYRLARRLAQNTKQLDTTIDLVSSFLVSTAYERNARFLQLEFEREGQQNAVYWYGQFPEEKFFRFLQSDSKGGFFNRLIKGRHQFARVQ